VALRGIRSLLWLMGDLCLLTLVGCAHTSQFLAAPPPDYLIDSAWLAPQDTLPDLGAVGYVLLGDIPDSPALAQYNNRANIFRRAFDATFHFTSLWTAKTYSRDYFVTFWLNIGSGDPTSGRDWYTHYDYKTASRLLHALGRLQSRGPILAAWHRDVRFDSAAPVDSALVLDLSNISDSDLDVALRIWRRRITENPAAWRHRFDLNLACLEFAGFLNEYGHEILAVVSPR